MKYTLFITILFLFSTLNTKGASLTTSQNTSKPIVKADSSYTIIIKNNIEYAKGLSHLSINSNIAQPIPLLLDAYIPDNTVKSRPAMVLIHGGGFAGGSKEHKQIVKMARYFASRGWVVFSINYRLKKHKGTIPDSWLDYAKQNFENQKSNKFFSLYPANRDAKAAIRWVYANAKSYNINTNFITVGGGSAGAVIATMLGVSAPEDYTYEIPKFKDPTISSTHLDQSSRVHTIIDFWGSKIALDILESTYKVNRFDASDAPILIVHGTNDNVVKYSNAEELKAVYQSTGVPYELYPMKNRGHGIWNSSSNGKNLFQLSFDFITKHQHLLVN